MSIEDPLPSIESAPQNGGTDLSILLFPDEIAKLRSMGRNPAEYTQLTGIAERIQQHAQRFENGDYILLVVLRIPPHLFREKSRLLVRGRNPDPLDGVFDVMPTVMLPVRIDKLTEEGKAQMRRTIEAQIAMLQAQQEALRDTSSSASADGIPVNSNKESDSP
jgi:hypothetical protein